MTAVDGSFDRCAGGASSCEQRMPDETVERLASGQDIDVCSDTCRQIISILATEVLDCRRNAAASAKVLADVIDIVYELTVQACGRDGELDSMAISTYADAIRFLGDVGRVTVTSDVGRRVIAVDATDG